MPAGRLARPDEVARGVAFLVDPASAYINGITLAIEGGLALPWWSKRGQRDALTMARSLGEPSHHILDKRRSARLELKRVVRAGVFDHGAIDGREPLDEPPGGRIVDDAVVLREQEQNRHRDASGREPQIHIEPAIFEEHPGSCPPQHEWVVNDEVLPLAVGGEQHGVV